MKDRLGVLALMPLPGGDFGRQWQAIAVRHEMDFRAKAAAGTAQSVVRRLARYFFLEEAPAAARLARMEEPSTHHRSKSIRPRWSR